MPRVGHYYAYGSYLVQPGQGDESFTAAEAQGDLGHLSIGGFLDEKALEHAAKKICNLQCGLCPIREEDFAGCPVTCHEEVRPWQCWVAHFRRRAGHAAPRP
jgi:hypothetical protein